MNYSKYFEGTVEADTSYTGTMQSLWQIERGNDDTVKATTTIIKNGVSRLRSRVLGEALASTLRDCGMDVVYRNVLDDSETRHSSYLYFNDTSDCGIYVGANGGPFIAIGVHEDAYPNDIKYGGYTPGQNMDWLTSNSYYQIFSNSSPSQSASYKFYITVVGDVNSMFQVYIGRYSDPSSKNPMFTMMVATDKRSDTKTYGIYVSTTAFITSSFYVFASQQNPTLIGSVSSVASAVDKVDNIVTLIDAYFPSKPFICPDDVYLSVKLSEGFYEINGEVYYSTSSGSGFLIKCTTEVTPTTEDNNG